MKPEKNSILKSIYTLILFTLTILIIYAIIKAQFSEKLDKAEETLVLTSIIFRHGDRCPRFGCPNCPRNKSDYFPYNFGELTSKGQSRMIRIGSKLKQRYGKFLGDIFFTDLIKSFTSNFARTQMSLQALHAGLFWTYRQNGIPGLSWQAVPYIINPQPDNLISIWEKSPRIFFNNSYLPAPNKQTQDVFDYLVPFCGFTTFGYVEACMLSDYIKTAAEFGYDPPEWITKVYPYPLRRIAVDAAAHFSQTWLKQGGSNLLKKITDDAIAKSKDTLLPKSMKMFLYSGHDLNIHFTLTALNLWIPEEIEYGAHLMLELHELDGVYGFKIFYNNWYKTDRLLRLPACGDFCPLDKFINLTKNSYPDKG